MEDSTPLPANAAEDPPTAERIEELQAKIRSMKARQASGTEPSPDSIGPYKILSVLGEGGMGTVYLAEQKTPVRRRVALKVIKLGMDSKQILARFEAERQALAMMEHSNIARVYEAGMTETGQPFFAMEHVKGTSINHFCDQHKLSLEERLTLFKQLCSGVQHAHQKGVIHRDLKPSNVLITDQDGKPTVKIIDFGVARATDHRLVEATIFTEQGQVIGTPEYMSPEQAGLDALDIDTRSDVYSLGVLLYELLVGELPFSRQELRQAGLREMERKIREEEPPKPSTRLTASHEEQELVAKQRHTDFRSLMRRMRGDLDWIVMKALEKNRAHRYGTAEALAEDIQRHLSHEPVLAGRPSTGYRLKKMLRKYRGQVAAAALVFLVLIGGIIGTSVGFAKARDNEILANERAASLATALTDAQTARAAAQEQRELAEGEAERAKVAKEETTRRAAELEQVVGFQVAQISDIDPAQMGIHMRKAVIAAARAAMDRSMLSTDIVDERIAAIEEQLEGTNFTNAALDTLETNLFTRALAAIDAEFADQPLVQARLLQAEANILRRLGFLEKADEAQTRALAIRRRELGDDHPDTLISINNMGFSLQVQGKFAEAEVFYREVLDGMRRVLGDDDEGTLTAIGNMGAILKAQRKDDEAEPYFVKAIEERRRVLGEDSPATLRAINNMGNFLHMEGKHAEAELHYREALKGQRRVRGDDHLDTLATMSNLGNLLRDQQSYAEAETLTGEALTRSRKALGDSHVQTLQAINNTGRLLMHQNKFAQAEPYLVEALEGRRRVLGNDHPLTLASINTLGFLYWQERRYTEAEPYYRESLEKRRRFLGNDHPATLTSINNMGALIRDRGEPTKAEPYFLNALKGRRRVFGEDHPLTLDSIHILGHLYVNQGQLTEAEPHYVEVLERRRRVQGEGHVDFVHARNDLINLLEQRGDYLAAEELRFENDSGKAEAHWLRMLAIDEGEADAESPDEMVHLAYHLYGEGRLMASYETFSLAFDDAGSSVREKYRYYAARAAIRAGCGEGEDALDPSSEEGLQYAQDGRAMLREQLGYWRDLLAVGGVRTAKKWATWARLDPDLACVRNQEALSKLDDGEAEEWKVFWREVEELLK